MESKDVILCVVLMTGLLFEAANGVQIGCFACYSSERACKRDIMNELGASKNINCEYCVTLYSTNEAHTIRSCRTEKSGYYTEDPTDRCKPTSLPGEYRCWCFSDWCNGKEQDVRFTEYLAQQSGGGTGSGTTKKPSSMAVSFRMSGQAVLGFMILTLLQYIAL